MGGGSSKTASSSQGDEPQLSKRKNGNSGTNNGAHHRKKLYSIPRDFLDEIPDAAPRTLTSNGLISDCIVQNPTKLRTSLYDDTLSKLKESGSNVVFQDPEFPPQIVSLTQDVGTFERGERLVWKRPTNFLDSKQTVTVFADGIFPADIKQGILADNYFLSALAILAENPKLIRRIFLASEINPYGCYAIWLCRDGEWTQIVVDDNFPCSEEAGPVFSRCQGNQLWVCLLEKAYSQLYGTYDQIQCGLIGHAIRDFTGCPYTYYIRDSESSDFSQTQEVWKVITQNFKKKYMIIASKERNDRALVDDHDDLGITSQNCFLILDTQEVTAVDGSRDQILKIKDQWQKLDWQGDWSDNSNQWSQELAAQLKKKGQQVDGTFWIGIQDFVQEFSQFCICQIVQDYLYASIRVSRVTSPSSEKITTRLFSIKSTGKTHGWITLSQKDRRHFAQNATIRYNYSLLRIIICSLDQSGREVSTFVGEGFECQRDVDVEVNLDHGEYLVYIEVEWAQDVSRDLVISSYTSQPVVFSEIQIQQKNLDNLLNDIIETHQSLQDLERLLKYTEKEDIYRVSGSVCGYIYYFYQNNSGNIVLKETIKMKEKRCLEGCDPNSQLNDQTVIEVQPGEKRVCKYRVQAIGRGEYSYSTSINYILLEKIQDEEVLREKARNNASKMKQREMNGLLMDVFVHTYVYYGGLALLYINQTQSQTYVEDLELKLENLQFEGSLGEDMIHLEVQSNGQKLINLQQLDLSQDISYSTQMTYFLK